MKYHKIKKRKNQECFPQSSCQLVEEITTPDTNSDFIMNSEKCWEDPDFEYAMQTICVYILLIYRSVMRWNNIRSFITAARFWGAAREGRWSMSEIKFDNVHVCRL